MSEESKVIPFKNKKENIQQPETEQTVNATIFKNIIFMMLDIYIKKNADYGDSFSESVFDYGLLAPAIRIGDKYRRFKTLIKQEGKVKDEAIEDTLLDLANYAVMTLVELKKIEYLKERMRNDDVLQ